MKKTLSVLLLSTLALLVVSCIQQSPAPDTPPNAYPAESTETETETIDPDTEPVESDASTEAYPAESTAAETDTAEGDASSEAYPAESTDEQPEELPIDLVFGEALVDSVIVEQREDGYVAIVNGNLNDACTQIHESTQAVSESTIQITLTTVRPGDLVCAQMLTPYTEEIAIDTTNLAPGDYTVEVNSVAADGAVSIGEALVDSAAVEQRDDGFVTIVNGNLNDACTQLNGSTQTVAENTIQITLTTVRPGDMMCAQMLSPYSEEILIDTIALAPGDYTVEVNSVAADGTVTVGDVETAGSAVTGTVSYTQRIALPENATLTVQIQDTSLADAPATVIGEQSYVTDGRQVPLPFAVAYNPDDIQENHDYTLSVRITLRHKLLFINDTVVPVITKDNPTSDVAVTVVPVGGILSIAPQAPASGEAPPAETEAPASSEEPPVETDAPANGDDLPPIAMAVNKTWQWAGFNDPANGEQEISEPGRYELLLNKDGTASIKADCNMVSATYTVDGNGILIEQGATTLAACPPDSLADQYLQYLAATRIFFFQEDEMLFDLMADSGTMRFSGPEAASAEDLIGPLWQWVDISTANTSTAVSNPEKYSIQFLLDGVANIKADCNNILANYTIEGDSVTIEMGPTTMVFCGEESLDQQFVQGLSAVTSYHFDGDLLYLDTADDTGSLGFMSGGEQVTGNVLYVQRSALPADSVLTVTVQDVSLADAPAVLIGVQTYTTDGAQVPLPYAVSNNPDVINENLTYSVSARITDADGKLLFISDTMIPVITNGNPTSNVEIQVVPVN